MSPRPVTEDSGKQASGIREAGRMPLGKVGISLRLKKHPDGEVTHPAHRFVQYRRAER
ncbi:MAG: hypothetical protein U0936_10120 [Planctomycetaceae bacterium]